MRVKRPPKLDTAWRWPDRVKTPFAAFNADKKKDTALAVYLSNTLFFTSFLCRLRRPSPSDRFYCSHLLLLYWTGLELRQQMSSWQATSDEKDFVAQIRQTNEQAFTMIRVREYCKTKKL